MADADNTRNGRPARAGRKRKADEIDREDKKQGERRRVVEVVPNADVTFKVGTGEEARDIKVSGVVVSLASEVFSRMLSSSFIEGRTRVISLPEDDPETVLTFCQIVHHRAENLNRLGPGEPNKLAVFADMRLCTTALRPWVVMRLSPLIERLDQGSPKFWQHQEDEEQEDERNGNARDDIELFLPTMMLFRLEGMFWKSTRFLIWSTKPSKPRQEQNEKTESPRYDNIHGEYMQRMLWSELRAPVLTFADAVLQSARTSITSLLASVSECVDRGFEDSRKVLPCHISKYGFLMCVLRYKKIKTETLFADFDESNVYVSQMEAEGCTFGKDNPCDFCSRDIAGELEETVDKFPDAVPGICLVCYLSRGKDFLTLAEVCDHGIRNENRR